MIEQIIDTKELDEGKSVHHIEVENFSDKYHVRKLNKTDLEIIYRLSVGNKIYYQYHPPFVTRESILDDMTVLPTGKSIRDKYYAGFFEKESLIAVMDLISDYPAVGCGFIGLFMLDVDYQNRGIGSYIIDNVLGYLKLSKLQKVRLGVDKGNPQSYSFWRKNGFHEICENEYIVMERLL